MGSITIRKLDDRVKSRLRIQAAENNRSMEEEARFILSNALGFSNEERNLAEVIDSIFAKYDGIDIELPSRDDQVGEPPIFDEK